MTPAVQAVYLAMQPEYLYNTQALVERADLPEHEVCDALEALLKAGLVHRTEHGPRRVAVWGLPCTDPACETCP